MNISSTTLSQQDFDYFKANFKVEASTVSTLEEAEIILIGERHDCEIHKKKELWLLSKFSQEGDVLFHEVAKRQLDQKFFAKYVGITGAKNPHMIHEGWDSKVDRIALSNHNCEWNDNIQFCESIYNFEKNTDEAILKKNIIEIQNRCNKLEKQFQDKLKEANNLGISLTCEHLKDLNIKILDCSNYCNKLSCCCEGAQLHTGEKLQFLYSVIIKSFLDLTYSYDCLFNSVNFFNRNVFLSENVTMPNKSRKRNWGIPGKRHLKIHNRSRPGEPEAVSYLLNALEGKKYVILFPRKTNYLEIVKTNSIFTSIKSSISSFYEEINRESLKYKLAITAIIAAYLSNLYFEFLPFNLANIGFLGLSTLASYDKRHQENLWNAQIESEINLCNPPLLHFADLITRISHDIVRNPVEMT